MFKPVIDWPVYLAVCGILAAVYYAVILFRYNRGKLFKSGATSLFPLKGQVSLFPKDQSAAIEPATNRQPVELTHTVHELADELRALLQQLAAHGSGRDELLGAVSRLLKKYHSLKGSGFQHPLTYLVAAESESQCNISLTTDELTGLWN